MSAQTECLEAAEPSVEDCRADKQNFGLGWSRHVKLCCRAEEGIQWPSKFLFNPMFRFLVFPCCATGKCLLFFPQIGGNLFPQLAGGGGGVVAVPLPGERTITTTKLTKGGLTSFLHPLCILSADPRVHSYTKSSLSFSNHFFLFDSYLWQSSPDTRYW